MKSFITTLGICLLLSGTTKARAQDQTDQEKPNQHALKAAETITGKATIQDINKAKREITLKKDDGTTDTVKIPEAVKNFNQMKVGDIVTAKYSEAIAVAVRKSGEPPSATGRTTDERAAPGEKPAIKRTATTEMSASIEKIDKDKRELTLKGPEGNTKIVKVPEDVKKFDELKQGDQIIVTATQSLAIDVSKPQE